MSNFILAVHYGMDYDHIEYVEMTQGIPMRVTLTKDPAKATYRSFEEAKRWANDILRNGEGTGTWKIEVIPIEEANQMTQPDQSELDGLLSELGIGMCKFKPDSDSSPDSAKCYYCGGSKWKPRHTARATIVAYITANYTPNSEVEQLKSRIAWLEGKIEGLSNDNLTPHLTPHLTPKKLPRFEP